MNGSRSPDRPAELVKDGSDDVNNTPNGRVNPGGAPGSTEAAAQEPTTRSVGKENAQSPHAKEPTRSVALENVNGDAGAESEAETLIDSPVKKREAEKAQQKQIIKTERPAKSRIGSLPVPGEDDEESELVATPLQSTEMSEMKGSNEDANCEDDDLLDAPGSEQDDSDSGRLSTPESVESQGLSLGSSRAFSERPDTVRNGAESPNPRKRKHRASSVSLPRKRQSMDPPKRALRGMHSEGAARLDRSLSPRRGNHRRAASTQSTFVDGTHEAGTGNRKRRAITQFPVRDPKMKAGWEESDASSETTSLGQLESRRPQRGVGRSTSTPGRPNAREHKRHVNKYGFTRLAEACENDDLDGVKEWREKDPDQLELAEFAGNKPLQIAALNGNEEVVKYLIDQGCQIDCANVDRDTPLIDAAENGHLEVVKILLDAGVDPLRQNLKGQQALDVVTDDTDDAPGIRAVLRGAIEAWNSDDAKQRREEEEVLRHKAGASKELHFMARTYENLLRLVTINDRNGVQEFLMARVPVDNAIIAAAAKTGDQYLVNMLLAEMTDKKAYQKPEKPLMAVIGTSHFDMVKTLTELDQFNPLWRSRAGKSWSELAVERAGPHWQQEKELLQRLYDERSRTVGRRNSSPVTKRGHAKRKVLPKHEDDSDDEDDEEESAPRRGTGRRLMTRKAMRAVSGKELSDSDSDEEASTSDSAQAREPSDSGHVAVAVTMNPPGSPVQRRTAGRARTKSMSSAAAEGSPRTRRRSSSLRGPQDPALPTVPEKAEDPEAQERDQAAQAKFAIEEAQRLEAKRKEDEAAEAEAKRAEEEAKAEQERQAEEARKEAEERERKAEKERKAQEERRRKEIEMDGARRNYRRDVLAALPEPFAQILDEDSAVIYSEHDTRERLLDLCSPLDVIDEDEDQWLLNAQAAPLLGKRGLELLLPPQPLGFERTFCADWKLRSEMSGHARRRVDHVVHEMCAAAHCDCDNEGDDYDLESSLAFEAGLRRAVDNLKAIADAEKKLKDGTIKLELVRMRDVLSNLDPSLGDSTIEVRDLARSKSDDETRRLLEKLEIQSFTARLAEYWQRAPLKRAYIGGQEQEVKRPCTGKTRVVVHEK